MVLKAQVWTNAFYIIAGLLCYYMGAPVYIMYAFITLGILSWLGHYTTDRTGWLADHYGMYIAFSAIVSYTSGEPFLGIVAMACAFIINFAVNMYVAIGFLYALGFILFGVNHSIMYTLYIGIIFALGLLMQRLGDHSLKDKDYSLHTILHSSWHLFTAIGMSLMVLL